MFLPPAHPRMLMSMDRHRQRGVFIGYLLSVIALMSVVTLFWVRDGQGFANGQNQAKVRDDLISQFETIRMKVFDCVLSYPGGNNGLGMRPAYPAAPASGLVQDLICPGAPVGAQSIWGGQDGVFYPPRIRGMGPWRYAHDAQSVRVFAQPTDAQDLVANAGMVRAADRYASQASVSGGVITFVLVR